MRLGLIIVFLQNACRSALDLIVYSRHAAASAVSLYPNRLKFRFDFLWVYLVSRLVKDLKKTNLNSICSSYYLLLNAY